MSRNRLREATRETQAIRSRLTSGVVGGILLGLGGIWLVWILLQHFGGLVSPALPVGFLPNNNSAPDIQITPLVAAGITLRRPDAPATLNQQQALLIADQLEPDAATNAKVVGARYVLLDYPGTSTPATHPNFNNVPTWLVIYQKIPLESGEVAASANSSYDLYVFLDAQSGKELLVIRV